MGQSSKTFDCKMQSMIVYALCVTVTLSDYVLPGIGIAGRFPVRPPPTTMKTVEDDSDSGVGRWLWIPPEENENDSDIDEIPEVDTEEIPESDTEEFPEEASTTQVRKQISAVLALLPKHRFPIRQGQEPYCKQFCKPEDIVYSCLPNTSIQCVIAQVFQLLI